MTTTLKVSIVAAGVAALSAAVSLAAGGSDATQPGDWQSLFDGKTTKGWRGYKQASPPASWKAVDGLLVLQGKAGDLVSEEEFADFELSLEWKINEGGNSGIFYRVTEEPASIWHHAIEYQILDNARHKDGADTKTSTGACYALYGPSSDVTRSPGQWNETRIVARGTHVEHWLNGTKLVEFEIGTPDWNERVAASKFKIYPGFGKAPKGRIGLQDHGDYVAFRNIRIRRLTT